MSMRTDTVTGPAEAEVHTQAWRGLLQAHASLVATLSSELESEVGLPLTHFEVLVRLANSPDGQMRMQDLAGSVLLSKSGVTRLVDRMAESGLVERRACLSDRRVTWAGITPAGREALRRATPVHRRGIERHFTSHLTAEEARILAEALQKVTRSATPARAG